LPNYSASVTRTWHTLLGYIILIEMSIVISNTLATGVCAEQCDCGWNDGCFGAQFIVLCHSCCSRFSAQPSTLPWLVIGRHICAPSIMYLLL